MYLTSGSAALLIAIRTLAMHEGVDAALIRVGSGGEFFQASRR